MVEIAAIAAVPDEVVDAVDDDDVEHGCEMSFDY